MRIAQVAPLYESVPPKAYGGTERVVSYITEELVRLGHDVTLFASGDSITQAELVPCADTSLRLNPAGGDSLSRHICMLEKVLQRADEFDLIHYHVDYLHFPLSRRSSTPNVTTLHGRLDSSDLAALYTEFDDMPLVSISNAQREPLPWVNWVSTVHHGLPLDLYSGRERPGRYLAFIGRISPEKGLDRAIEIARRSGVELIIAAKVDRVDQAYFHEIIKPLLRGGGVDYIGEIQEHEKQELLGNAMALLFQIDWPEPFGLAMIEAMACGTPVIARNRGSIPEVINEGVTGFVVEDLDEAVQCVDVAANLNRREVRRVFERRFSVNRMVRDYLNVYQSLLPQRQLGAPATA